MNTYKTTAHLPFPHHTHRYTRQVMYSMASISISRGQSQELVTQVSTWRHPPSTGKSTHSHRFLCQTGYQAAEQWSLTQSFIRFKDLRRIQPSLKCVKDIKNSPTLIQTWERLVIIYWKTTAGPWLEKHGELVGCVCSVLWELTNQNAAFSGRGP